MRWVLVTLLAAVVLGGLSASRAAGASGYRILLASDRDGTSRWYSMRPDGSGLAPLLPPGSALVPVRLSGDHGTIAYRDSQRGIYVSRASGAGLRRLVRRAGDGGIALSRDGKRLAFWNAKGIWIVGADGRRLRLLRRGTGAIPDDWSPDGGTLLEDRVTKGGSEVVLQPLRGKSRVLARAVSGARDEAVEGWGFAPNGRWVAYLRENEDHNVLWLVRPDGTRRHRVPGELQDFDWSPDGTRLVATDGSSLLLVGVDGRGPRRLRPSDLAIIDTVMWAPDGHHLVLGARGTVPFDPQGIWISGLDGRDLRRLTSRGNNDLRGWTRSEPAQPEAPPVRPAERVVAADAVETSAPVAALSADGPSVAFVTKERTTDCDHVAVWTPADGSLRRFGPLPAPCTVFPLAIDEVVLAGSRVAWTLDTDSPCENELWSATFAEPVPVPIGDYACTPSAYHANGDGDLLVIDDESGLMRVGGGSEECEAGFPTAKICTTLRRGDHSAPIESVSGGLIAIREPGAVAVLDERGQLLRVFSFQPADVDAARLDGGRLVVWRFGVLEVYDVATGALELSRPMPAGYRLADVDGGVAVLLGTNRIMLLRLADGRSLTLAPGQEPTLADLEPPGLYFSYATGDGGGRVAFLPRAELVRQLDGSAW